jgi:two-component system, OmpR family, osmolarity sensor histidine kinase EnvZ
VRLVPRSLFGRTALVIIALVVLSQLLSATLLYFYYIGSRLERAAHVTGIEVKTLTLALRLLPPSQKERFIRELEQEQNIHILSGQETPVGIKLNTRAIRNFEELLGAQFERPVEIRWQKGLMWVRWQDEGSAIWIGLPRLPADREFYWPVAGWLLPGGLFGLLGALWIALRINRPLRALSQSSTLLGRGETPHDLAETGATEIASLNRVFNQMARDIQRLTADRILLLAGISHDLRTPLSRLRLSIEMLGDNTDEMLKQGMVQDIDDMDHIVEQFLAYIRDGEIEAVRQGDLNEIIQATASRYLRQGHTLVLDLQPLPSLPLRVVAMQRLLANLIDNALKHGGGKIEIRTRLLDGRILLSVLDRGPGIHLPPPGKGMSTYRARLGLVVVERIAQLHQGRLQLMVRDGGGLEARVELSLPTDSNADQSISL